MALKQRNLLEAFQDAGQKHSREESSSSGPFATPSGGGEDSGGTRPPRTPRTGAPLTLPPWAPVALLVLVAFVLGFALGRTLGDGADETAAAERPESSEDPTADESAGIRPRSDDSREESPSRNPTAPPSTSRERSGTTSPSAMEALADPANRYTVVVATYDAGNADYARATEKFLADQGFPVVPPVKRGNHLEILVGAAPTAGDLSELRERIVALTDWNGRKSFTTAYVHRIDDHVDR